MLLDEIGLFTRVAEAGTLSAAAQSLGVPKSTLSRAIARLEARTKVPLLYRAARSFTLTEEGRRFFEAVAPHVAGLGEATKLLGSDTEQPEGTLRVSAPLASGDLLGDALAHFSARYPKLRLIVELSSNKVDLVKDGFDAVLRGTAALRGDTLTVRKLGPGVVHFYAAPTYLARRGTPTEVEALTGHDLVAHAPTLRSAPYRTAKVQDAFGGARLVVNEFGFLRSLLRAGSGIGPLPPTHAALDVEEGRLVRVIPEWSHVIGALYLLYPTARRLPRKVEVFRDFLVSAFRQPE
jgi:DNA-binding transcriptional LysR family regulator